jgi:hypothetical protein
MWKTFSNEFHFRKSSRDLKHPKVHSHSQQQYRGNFANENSLLFHHNGQLRFFDSPDSSCTHRNLNRRGCKVGVRKWKTFYLILFCSISEFLDAHPRRRSIFLTLIHMLYMFKVHFCNRKKFTQFFLRNWKI